MNTPSHVAIAVAVLGNHKRPKDTAWIIWGALLPDIPMYLLFAFDILRGVSAREIFNERYFQDYWQMPMNVVNSIPLYLLLLLLAYRLNWRGVKYLCLAALLHIACDLPVHREDAHAHFWPLTDWKFISPVSYYDPRHYGNIFAPFEMLIVLISTYFGAKVFIHRWSRYAFVVISLFIPVAYLTRMALRAFGA